VSRDPSVELAGRYRLLGPAPRAHCYRAIDPAAPSDPASPTVATSPKVACEVDVEILQPGQLSLDPHELKLALGFRHEHVCAVLAHVEADGQRILVTAPIRGRTLRTWLETPRANAEILRVFAQLARALDRAHAIGLAHRNLGPDQIWLEIGFEGGARPLLSGFDLGRGRIQTHLSGEFEARAQWPGSRPSFEEQAFADQLAFCVVMWEAITGVHPFADMSPAQRHHAMSSGEFAEPHTNALTAQLRRALNRGMRLRPRDRHPSMAAVAEAIEDRAERRDQGRHPLLAAAALAATFAVGWGLAPEGPTLEEAHSDLDPRIGTAMALVQSARTRARAGDGQLAYEDARAAHKLLAEAVGPGAPETCVLGEAIAPLGDLLVAQNNYEQARMMYALAIKHLNDCDMHSEARALDDKKMVARALHNRELGIVGEALPPAN